MTTPSLVLAFVPVAPALAALLIAVRAVRGDAAVARLAVAAQAVALAAAATACSADRVGGIVACAVAGIALIVAGYAARSLQGGTIPYARFFVLLSLAGAGSLAIAVAADLRVLAAAWIATGLATSALLGVAHERPAARAWARRHLAVERVGDVAWIVVLLVAWRAYGTFDLGGLARAATAAPAPLALALAIVVAGVARSAIVPLHDWLPNSMEAPTPVSAFMHAGLVNGAGVLFAKTAFLLAGAPLALALAALLGGATAALGATVALVRPESKRRLGWSTVAQMGFMVLQCGCGAFAAAIVHLIAHGGYKSTAFLSVPGSIDAHKHARRITERSVAPHALRDAFASFAAPTLALALAWWWFGPRIASLPAAALVVALVWTAAVCAARGIAERALPPAVRVRANATIATGVVAYLVAVVAADAWIGAALPHLTYAPATLIAATIAALAGVCEGLGVRPRGNDALYALALAEGRALPAPVAA